MTPSTSAGFACIEFATDVLGIDLLPWQRWLLVHALELLPDGTFRFRTVVVLVARQNGKSTLAQVLALFFMYVRAASLVIGTAQNLDIAEEVWQGAVDIAEDVPELADEIERVVKVNGKKSLELVSGERYKVQAANRRGGRGLSGDLVIMDELREHQSWDSWSAVTKTTLARILAQIWALSNAGDAASIVLRHLRLMAHVALGDPDGIGEKLADVDEDDDAPDELDDLDDDSLGLFEWSAPPGCDLNDRAGWAQANPSLGHTITERAIASALRTDPEWVFRTEVLCQWSEGTLEGPFPPGAWDGSRDPESRPADDSPLPWGLDVSWDRTMTYIGVAGWREDGLPHVELVAQRAGTDWPVAWFTDPEHPERMERPVAIQAKGAPASGLIDALTEAGVTVLPLTGEAMAEAAGDLYDRVRAAVGEGSAESGLRHRGQAPLDVAAANASTKPWGDAWLWDRRKSPVDVAPLQAVTNALRALTTGAGEPEAEPSIRFIGG